MKKVLSVSFYIMLAFYCILMLFLFFRIDSFSVVDLHAARRVNLIPFQTITEYLNGTKLMLALNNVLGNIIVFIPYGIYIQVLRKDKRFGISFLQVLFTSVSIEIIQFAFNLGAADIDDVILNCLGGLIGIGIYKLLLKMVKEPGKVKKIIAILSLVVGGPIILIMGLLMMNGIFISFYKRT